ncbi:peptidoglycan-binding protein [Marinobacter sp. C1S70]|uniref:ExeA family protein n=1 Tax=Marinobacter sp. C1S70 TaxID=1396859 RepID=UPI0003B8191A|nr:ExeA family protein [Marinobacter sp. C1S70]ERS90353.1 peptidoglycan-binding protein [Marinobacter sp. C1S70]
MYYDFFGFREPPFSIAPDPRYLYLSDRHKEALAHLMYGVQGQGGFIVITGEVGTGKTTVCRCFIENAPAHVDIALVLNPRLSARELLSSVCDELEIAHQPDASIKTLVDSINQDLLKAHAAGRHKVLIIDEAQNLSAEVLEQLRLLTNLETSEKKLLQIVLLGQPELQEILALPELRQLNQRVTARYHLDAIDRQELPAYLQYRLNVAGMRGDIFTPGAVRRLYRESQGVPRLINLISDRALLGAYAEGDHLISVTHIRKAAKEVNGGLAMAPAGGTFRSRGSHVWLVVASVILAIIGTLWLLEFPGSPTPALAEPKAERSVEGVIEREAEPEPKTVSDSDQPVIVAPEPTAPGFVFNQHTQSLAEAFGALFDLWGKNYEPSANPIACDYAATVGLACLERQGSRRSLEFINRPAILQLRDESGRTRQVVVERLDGDLAVIATPRGSQQVPFREIEDYWYGDFRVLWRIPEFMTGDGFYGDDSGQQLWIGARMMELAERLSSGGQEAARVKRMEMTDQVRWYQEKRGLTVDGIAGAMTIIQMNNDLAENIPRLVSSVMVRSG